MKLTRPKFANGNKEVAPRAVQSPPLLVCQFGTALARSLTWGSQTRGVSFPAHVVVVATAPLPCMWNASHARLEASAGAGAALFFFAINRI